MRLSEDRPGWHNSWADGDATRCQNCVIIQPQTIYYPIEFACQRGPVRQCAVCNCEKILVTHLPVTGLGMSYYGLSAFEHLYFIIKVYRRHHLQTKCLFNIIISYDTDSIYYLIFMTLFDITVRS